MPRPRQASASSSSSSSGWSSSFSSSWSLTSAMSSEVSPVAPSVRSVDQPLSVHTSSFCSSVVASPPLVMQHPGRSHLPQHRRLRRDPWTRAWRVRPAMARLSRFLAVPGTAKPNAADTDEHVAGAANASAAIASVAPRGEPIYIEKVAARVVSGAATRDLAISKTTIAAESITAAGTALGDASVVELTSAGVAEASTAGAPATDAAAGVGLTDTATEDQRAGVETVSGWTAGDVATTDAAVGDSTSVTHADITGAYRGGEAAPMDNATRNTPTGDTAVAAGTAIAGAAALDSARVGDDAPKAAIEENAAAADMVNSDPTVGDAAPRDMCPDVMGTSDHASTGARNVGLAIPGSAAPDVTTAAEPTADTGNSDGVAAGDLATGYAAGAITIEGKGDAGVMTTGNSPAASSPTSDTATGDAIGADAAVGDVVVVVVVAVPQSDSGLPRSPCAGSVGAVLVASVIGTALAVGQASTGQVLAREDVAQELVPKPRVGRAKKMRRAWRRAMENLAAGAQHFSGLGGSL
ncbi:hypothetical protein BC828DRAFT_385955 [Blastocladiella britannica]|nr:hypothetical protein BC828DRAFT_385955 [Blastocladiella britannica]